MLRSTAAIRSIRQCWVCFSIRPSISLDRSLAVRKRSSAKPRTSSSTFVRSAQNDFRTASGNQQSAFSLQEQLRTERLAAKGGGLAGLFRTLVVVLIFPDTYDLRPA